LLEQPTHLRKTVSTNLGGGLSQSMTPAHERVVPFAYKMVKMGTIWYLSIGTNLYSVDKMNERG
jgi:hypothetical protein